MDPTAYIWNAPAQGESAAGLALLDAVNQPPSEAERLAARRDELVAAGIDPKRAAFARWLYVNGRLTDHPAA